MITLLAAALALSVAGTARAQSACAEIGVDCSHPNSKPPQQGQSCDSECRAWLQDEIRENQQYAAWLERQRQWQEELKRRKAEAEAERRRRGEEERALEQERKRIERATFFGVKADASFYKSDWKKAVEYYDNALSLYPDWPHWRSQRATAYLSMGQNGPALLDYNWVAMNGTDEGDVRLAKSLVGIILAGAGYTCHPSPPNSASDCEKIMGAPGSWSALGIRVVGDMQIRTSDGRVLMRGEELAHVDLRRATITTGDNSKVQIALPDDTLLTIGSNSQMELDDYVYDPSVNAIEAAASFSKGVLRLISAPVQKAQHRINLKMNVGSLGVRGTDVEIVAEGVGADGRTFGEVRLYSGAVDFTDPVSGKKVELSPGQSVRFGTGDGVGTPRPLDR